MAYPIIFILSLIGLGISIYLYRVKLITGGKPICLPGFKCDVVMMSKYSSIWGIPLELLGIIYFVIMSTISLWLAVNPEAMSPVAMLIIVAATLGSFLFSLYLVGIQHFAIKAYCNWCLLVELISTIIFITITSVNYDLVVIFLTGKLWL